ncbi:MAG: aldo/keto reductase [Symbiobacteriaceae bacterium]|nr:aldo/keto reductase [Symbiobacteriaceae bacterium]
MQKNRLGETGLEVTNLCMGILPMGPNQKHIPQSEGAKLIRQGVEAGINFLDTAEMYGTHSYIEEALRGFQGEVVIASKSVSDTYEAMCTSVEKARTQLNRDVIDIFHIHAARADVSVFDERAGAIAALMDLKARGIIRAVGISVHGADVCIAAASRPEFDVVFPIINKRGMGIINGNLSDMLRGIALCHQSEKGIYAMKALAGGHLIDEIRDAFAYVQAIPGIASLAVGMVKEQELHFNLKYFNGEEINEAELPHTQGEKRLHVLSYCVGCGTCTKICPNYALSVSEGKVQVDHSRCILCGYCSPACPLFALRLV